MAWREYVDPTDGKTYLTDDAGNFLPGGLAQNGINVAPPAAPSASAGGNFNWGGLWGAMTGSNQQQFDEMVRQFNTQMDIEGRKLGMTQQQIDAQKQQFAQTLAEQQRQFNTSTTVGLAQSLLNGATSLRGPENWLDYAQYTGGGRDIFSMLTGDQAAPAFGAPTGYSKPMDIQSLLRDLGVPNIGNLMGGTAGGAQPGATTPSAAAGAENWGPQGTTGNPQVDAQLMQIWENRPDIQQAYATNPHATQQGNEWTPLRKMMEWWKYAQPTGEFQQGEQGASGLGNFVKRQGWGTPQAGGPMQIPLGGEDRTSSGIGAGQVESGKPSLGGQAQSQQAPLPHQINPAVWDSMSPTAQKMILAAVEKGNTPSGAWSAEDYVRQMNAARPKGNAPRQVSYNWAQPQGSYF